MATQSKYEMKQMVLTDLADVCKKLSESSAVTEEQRTQMRQFAKEFDSLLPFRGEDIPEAHFEGEYLLARMARSLSELADDYDPDAYLDRAS